MNKNRFQMILLGLSLMISAMNVVGLILSKVNFTDITNSYLAPFLVIFSFFQTVLVVLSRLKVQ